MIFACIIDTITNNAPIAIWGLVSLSLSVVLRNIIFKAKLPVNTQELYTKTDKDYYLDLELIKEDHIMEALSNVTEHFDFTCYKLLISATEDIVTFRQLLKSDYDKLAFNHILLEEERELLSDYYAIIYNLTHIIEKFNDILNYIS